MQTVSRDFVNLTIANFDSYSERKVQKLMMNFTKRQPEINEYMGQVAELSEWDEMETSSILMFTVMIFTTMFRTDPKGMKEVSETQLLAAQYANERLFNKMDEEEGSSFEEQVFKMIEEHNQTHIMGFIVSSVLSAHHDSQLIRQFQVPQAILYLKTILDSMDEE